MPRKRYFHYLDDQIRLVVYFDTRKGEVLRFVVKLEYHFDDDWRELLRYDCFHGAVHKDILERSGEKTRVVKYGFFDPGTGLNAAIADCTDNYRSYIERWRNA